ncbi:MAG TPA: sigma-70 family RNA polymerase sigma factor [Ardenticatenaceae bacterium]|nr:sigma-70 family RNA polymerase sigma factor [Ardenticatenaceae bacterium]
MLPAFIGALFLLGVVLLAGLSAAAPLAPPGPSDDELATAARRGDRAAFNRLVGRYQSLAYNIAYRVLHDADAAADATQEAFLAAFRRIDQFHGGSFKAWLARIVTNQCYDSLRYQKRRPTASLDALLLEPDDPPALRAHAPDRPDEVFLQRELAGWLQTIIMQLPPDQRVALVLADVQGFSYEEIAEATEVELGTVKSRLSRARRRVRDLLQAQPELLPAKYRFEGNG